MSKRRNYTFALKNNYGQVIEHLENHYRPVDDFSDVGCRFAYICHDQDEGSEMHYHFFIEFDNARSRASVARELNIPENMIQDVINRKGIIGYLTHTNAKSKYQYDSSDIVANFDWKNITETVDLVSEMADYRRVRQGLMTMEEFVMSHNISCQKLAFFSRIKLYDILTKSHYNAYKEEYVPYAFKKERRNKP